MWESKHTFLQVGSLSLFQPISSLFSEHYMPAGNVRASCSCLSGKSSWNP